VKRGDVVLAAIAGDYGKVRPAVVVQDDALIEAGYNSVVVCPMTSFLSGGRRARVVVTPSDENGLDAPSEIMVEKLIGLARTRCRQVIGRLDASTMQAVDISLMIVLGLTTRRID
jgi:mRNA interferase MazF